MAVDPSRIGETIECDRLIVTTRTKNKNIQLWSSLIPATVLNAWKHVPFYKAIYDQKNINIHNITLEEFGSLPIVTKKQLESAGSEAYSRQQSTAAVQHTSSTTGDCFLIHRSREEADWIQSFFFKLDRDRSIAKSDALTLNLTTPIHGTPIIVPSNSFQFNESVLDRRTAKNTVHILRCEHLISQKPRRIRVICGSMAQVVFLTQYLTESSIEASEFEMKAIIVHGWYCSSYYMKYLQNYWRCPVLDRYSLAEIFGGASSIDRSPHVFDPHVMPEVVNSYGDVRPAGEVGRLVLTSLYPFVQKQPFIRYDTGDLFEIVQGSENGNQYRFRGRRVSSLRDPKSEDLWWLLSADLSEVLDQFALVSRANVPSEWLSNRAVHGLPIWRGLLRMVEDRRYTATLEAETACPISHSESFTQRMEISIREELLLQSHELREATEKGLIDFKVKLRDKGTFESPADQPHQGAELWRWHMRK